MNEQLENLKWLVENLPNVNESMSFLITELEETNRAFGELDSDYINLIKENKRYREAYENAKYKYISLAPYGAEMQRDGMLQEINKALEGEE